MSSTEFWMLVAGLDLFLYGMSHLEEALKQMEGRSFKLFLQKKYQKENKGHFQRNSCDCLAAKQLYCKSENW